MFMTIIVIIMLLFLWGLVGELGWHIWRIKVLETCNLKLGTLRVLMNIKILACRNRFRASGPFGLYVGLNYSNGDNNKRKK